VIEVEVADHPVQPEIVPSIVVDHADIRYRVYEEPQLSARKLVSRGFRSRRAVTVHAVKDVSFTVGVGEAVGIVGSNGSGKSTLLRGIAGLQTLSGGSIKVRGEVGLLGVGAALKPSLSGHRNIVLGGLALGMSSEAIEALLPEVIAFTGLEDAINRPMKTYSSGMRARLAFAISTLRVPEVLLIDEALAVGDKQFRAMSLQRLNEIKEQAGTVVLVSHNLSEIRETCDRVIWLDQGVVRVDGSADEVLAAYESDG
jgi:teichoic acid transport system ATP-binding protein